MYINSLVFPLVVEKRAGATSKFSPLLLNCHINETTPGSAATWHLIFIVSSNDAPTTVTSESLLHTGASADYEEIFEKLQVNEGFETRTFLIIFTEIHNVTHDVFFKKA